MASFENLLHELASRTGITLDPYQPGEPVTLQFNGEHTVTMQHDEEAKCLVLSSRLLLDEPGGEPRLCAALLAAGNLGVQTRGAAFGLDPATGEVFLWQRLPEYLPDYFEFERALESFVGQTAYWSAWTRETQDHAAAAAAAAAQPRPLAAVKAGVGDAGFVAAPGASTAILWEQMRV